MLLLAGLVLGASAAAQDRDAQAAKDIERLVREGKTETLEDRLRGGRTVEDKHLLAQAYANKARRQRRPEERQRTFEKADEKYRRWIAALEPAARGGTVADRVRLAAGRVEYASMILSGQAAGELDEFEISAGQRGDRKLLVELLETARAQYEQAEQETRPLMGDLGMYEEDLLAAGLYDTLQQASLDLALNLGWASYYLGVLTEGDDARKRELLASAERKLQELVNFGQTGQTRYLCRLALAMAQSQQGRYDDAANNFRYAMGDDVAPVLEAQIRYELARSQISNGQFDEARTTLRPLVEKQPWDLSPDDLPARFYINLAHIWDAHSYLLEADAIRRDKRSSASRTANLQRADRTRETGLRKMNRLANQGGPWPALVQIYVRASMDMRRPVAELSPLELLYTAQWLIDAKKYKAALKRLEEAATRADADSNVAVDVLFELGRCQYQLKNARAAAAAFQKLAAEHRGHPKAAQAATFAYQLWGKVAESNRRQDDYLQLAATLRNLVENFADHPNRVEALWLWPVALQLAGRYEDAAQRFGNVPDSSQNWEEAQYRQVVCARKAFEAKRGSLAAEDYRQQCRQSATALRDYAQQARERAELAINRDAVLSWSAEARVGAAELLMSPGVDDYRGALESIVSFEQEYPDNELVGRVLAVRIRAHRGLREFEQAAKILSQFLETASPAQVGGTLAALAKGMQEEVQRLLDEGQGAAARKLATDSVATFAELEKWVRADASRAQNLDFVLSGRARMHYLAGQFDAAETLVTSLLKENPRNGNHQHLRALILTARLGADTPAAELQKVQEAWAALLGDAAIRTRAPERYWEARYNWLALALRLGNAADVETAITQERVWFPDLGGASWQAKLERLLDEARAAQGKPVTTQPGG